MGSQQDPYALRGTLVLGLTFMGFAVCLLLSVILHYHVPLAMRNLTSVEDFYDNMPNPYEQGSTLANLAQIFGEFGVDWFLPIKPCRPVSDGVSFLGGPNELPMAPVLSSPVPSDRTDQAPLLLQERLWDDGNMLEDAVAHLPCSCGCVTEGDGPDDGTVPQELRGQFLDVEEFWRTRYKVRVLHDRLEQNFDEHHSVDGSPAKAPTLLKDVWSSFWRGRTQSHKRAVWL